MMINLDDNEAGSSSLGKKELNFIMSWKYFPLINLASLLFLSWVVSVSSLTTFTVSCFGNIKNENKIKISVNKSFITRIKCFKKFLFLF